MSLRVVLSTFFMSYKHLYTHVNVVTHALYGCTSYTLITGLLHAVLFILIALYIEEQSMAFSGPILIWISRNQGDLKWTSDIYLE